MRIFIYSDPHWCSYSSILRSRGVKYTSRLENLINSINWCEQTAVENNCNAIFCLGDFFDQSTLDCESLTALQEIKWSNLSHLFLVGNHEMGRSSLEFSSAHLLKLCPNMTVVDKSMDCHIDDFHRFIFLPYSLDSSKINIKEQFGQFPYHQYIFSHNDLKGIQMGSFISKEGLDINDILNNCDYCFNGHLHNFEITKNKIIGIGNITGQNFSEDAYKYDHKSVILDTNDNSLIYFENPFSLNFYKIDLCDKDDNFISILKNVKSNSIVSIKCYQDKSEYIRQFIDSSCENIIDYRIVILRRVDDSNITNKEDLLKEDYSFSIDHLKSFKEFIFQTVGTDELIQNELNEVIK